MNESFYRPPSTKDLYARIDREPGELLASDDLLTNQFLTPHGKSVVTRSGSVYHFTNHGFFNALNADDPQNGALIDRVVGIDFRNFVDVWDELKPYVSKDFAKVKKNLDEIMDKFGEMPREGLPILFTIRQEQSRRYRTNWRLTSPVESISVCDETKLLATSD